MLNNIRVIEIGTAITAPLAGMMLGDLGADVIKIESPDGDHFRRSHGGTYGPNFIAYNRNKRSAVLDLTTAVGLEALLKLLEEADVFLDNMRSSALVKLGLAYEKLSVKNPRLIHCSITGFGSFGPYRDRPAFDGVALALSGVASLLTDPNDPMSFGPTISDNVAGMYASYAILGALVERAHTGRGRRLEVNMLETSMAFVPDAFSSYTQLGVIRDRLSRVAISQSFAFRCADGALIAIHLSTREKFWQAFTKAVGAADLAVDPRFITHVQRAKHYLVLREILAERLLARSRSDWMERFIAADVPFAPILNVAEVLADPQVAALETMYEGQHPVEGKISGINCPVLVDGARPKSQMALPPMLGEHTTEVLSEVSQTKSPAK